MKNSLLIAALAASLFVVTGCAGYGTRGVASTNGIPVIAGDEVVLAGREFPRSIGIQGGSNAYLHDFGQNHQIRCSLFQIFTGGRAGMVVSENREPQNFKFDGKLASSTSEVFYYQFSPSGMTHTAAGIGKKLYMGCEKTEGAVGPMTHLTHEQINDVFKGVLQTVPRSSEVAAPVSNTDSGSATQPVGQ